MAAGPRPRPLSLLLLLLAALSVAPACGQAVSTQPATGTVAYYAPPPGLDVRHYALDLTVDPARRYLQGLARLEVRHPDTLRTLPLLLEGMTVGEVLVDGRPVEAERGERARLFVPLDGDTVSVVTVHYEGVPLTGLYAAPAEGQEAVVFTDSWPARARGWMPGVHHPSDPATLDLVLRTPAGPDVVATGDPVAPTEAAADSAAVRVTRWRLRAPAPTYAYAFALGDFARVDAEAAGPVPVRYYMLAADSARADRLARTPAMIRYFSGLIGAYPYAHYASVQVPIGYGGMENASLAFLRDGLFDGPPTTRPDTTAVEGTQAHEAVHQWFGDRVPIADWRDLWLSEGTATYLTTLFYEHADGLDRARQEWVEMAALSDAQLASHGPLVPEGPVDPDAHLTWVPYRKGGSVLHLLRRVVGDKAFTASLRRAYAEHQDVPIHTSAFRAILEAESGRDLGAVFDYWVYGDALPVLHTTWDAGTRTLQWRVEGDGETLDGVPFALAVTQGGTTQYVPAGQGSLVLDGAEAPGVHAVGIMLAVE